MFTVHVVDDDPAFLKALTRLLRARGYETRSFSSAEAFLDEHDPAVAGCAIFDVAMPGLDGLDLQERLSLKGNLWPVIFLTGKSDIPISVRAMKAGAIDFLTKPVQANDLFEALVRAETLDVKTRKSRNE